MWAKYLKTKVRRVRQKKEEDDKAQVMLKHQYEEGPGLFIVTDKGRTRRGR
jgi:hypothetical protein